MSRACVCGGSNENCRFCGGLGTVEDTLGTALDGRLQRMAVEQSSLRSTTPRRGLTSHRALPKLATRRTGAVRLGPRSKPTQPPARLVPCPQQCGASLNPRNLQRHLRRVHGQGQAVTVDLQARTQLQMPATTKHAQLKYESCSMCKTVVRAGGLPVHIAKAHRKTRTDSTVSYLVRALASLASKVYRKPQDVGQRSNSVNLSPTKSLIPEGAFTVCPICKASITAAKFQKHMNKVHTRRSRNVGGRSGSVQSSNEARTDTTLVAPRDKNLDATKLYAHSYRERGRFGSHPSHDGFDDESGPDESR